jgi:hypothetical protein
MIDLALDLNTLLSTLFDLSRTYCIPICAVLVPANLMATLQTMLLSGFCRPIAQVQLMALVSSLYASILLLHVFTWFAIGVVMAPTYILTVLGCVCITINFCAVLYRYWRGQQPAATASVISLAK